MFKVLVLQTLYTLSDDATEYQLKDRLSFMRFCGSGAARSGAGCQDDLALSRAADPGRGACDGCSSGSMPSCASAAIWRWAGRSSMRRWSRRAGRG